MATIDYQTIQDTINNYAKLNSGLGIAVGVVGPDDLAGTSLVSATSIPFQGQPDGPLTDQTPFELGSVSKLFTTDIFITGGGGDLDLPLGLFLDVFAGSQLGAVPVGNIANYSSGLPQDNGTCPRSHNAPPWPADFYVSLDNMVNQLVAYDGESPGQFYTYSNAGFYVLAMAALLWTDLGDTQGFGEAWNNALAQYCAPIGATTGTAMYFQSDRGALPVGLDRKNNPISGPPRPSAVYYGGGGVVSNAADMTQYLRYCLGLNIEAGWGAQELMQTQWTPYPVWCNPRATQNCGYGWFIQQSSSSAAWVAKKDGSIPGFTSWIVLYWPESTPNPSDGYGMFIMVNSQNNATSATTIGAEILPYVLPSGTPAELLEPGESTSGPGIVELATQ